MLSLKYYKACFVTIGICGILMLVFLQFSSILQVSVVKQRFSELWILGRNQMIGDYPLDVSIGVLQGPFHVSVTNHLGSVQYYRVLVKISNGSQQPDSPTKSPSLLKPVFEYSFFLTDGGTSETNLNFAILDGALDGDSLNVRHVSINGTVSFVDVHTIWDSENRGFFFFLFLELWLYNSNAQRFDYHNRYVGTWLNLTL